MNPHPEIDPFPYSNAICTVRSPTSLATAPFSKSLVAPMTFVHVEFQCDKFRHFDEANH